MPKIQFTIPGQAPSKGNFRRAGKDWRKRWRRIKEFEEDVGKRATSAGAKQIAKKYNDKDVTVTTDCYNQRADAGNIAKGVVDAMKGICYKDDAGVREQNYPYKDRKKGRVVVTVEWKKRK